MSIVPSEARAETSRESEPAEPGELAEEIAREGQSQGSLLIVLDYEAILGGSALDVPLLVRGALVALATASDACVVIVSAGEASHLETRIKVPGVVYVGASPNLERIVAQRRSEAREHPIVVLLGAGESFAKVGKVRYAVHVGRPRGEPAASHWVFDRASAVELLARLAFAWSAPTPTP
ncbi:MAG TPA: hypothetical protein VKV41_17285 [Methylomirabilota bacterium]|jgi:hypothetical protein|nr:hypothetical protein [Methylomirabilota bacterium]